MKELDGSSISVTLNWSRYPQHSGFQLCIGLAIGLLGTQSVWSLRLLIAMEHGKWHGSWCFSFEIHPAHFEAVLEMIESRFDLKHD